MVVQFDFHGARTGSYWLVLEPGAPSVCWEWPGFETGLLVITDTLALHRVWLSQQTLANAIGRGEIVLDGPRDLTRAFPSWLALSIFAGVQPASPATR